MSTLFLRDDDANATTDPRLLERTYAPLLDAGIPVNFSVIPEVALDTRAPDGARERFLSPDAPDRDALAALEPDAPLARWLRANRAVAGVLQHGWTHRRVRSGTEFGALAESEAIARIDAGAALLERAVGPAQGFVAPWDALSPGAFLAAIARFRVLSTGWVSRAMLPAGAWASHMVERLARREVLWCGRSLVLRHRGGPIGPQTSGDEVPGILARLEAGARVAVVVLHHWMYAPDASGEPHPAIVALARSLKGRRVAHIEELTLEPSL